MSEIISSIKSAASQYFEEIVGIRRHLHAHPELSFQEHQTADYIQARLEAFGISNSRRIADTGVTCTIHGNGSGREIALRADIDALPITEENDVAYRSTNEGVMHACGHDVHTASMLGACRILLDHRDHFNGSIKIIFQPGEEKLPGGASILIKEGILRDPEPAAIIGQHVMPAVPVGKVGFRQGMYMASADEIYMTIVGKGGHAAMPENFIDPVSITAQIITALQQVVSRTASPKIPSVLSFGKITGNGATNVIPDQVSLEGTFRTFDEEWRAAAHNRIETIATGIAESMGAKCHVDIRKGYPYLVNEPELTARKTKAAEGYMGEGNVVDLDLWMAGEDFAFYSHHVDACFYRLGTGNAAKGITSGVHTPRFDIDEDALQTGMGLMAWLAIDELQS